jgi:hypothetical protein
MAGLESIGHISPRIGTESRQVLVYSTTSRTGSSYRIRNKSQVFSAAWELDLSGFAGPRLVAGDQSQVYIQCCAGRNALGPY